MRSILITIVFLLLTAQCSIAQCFPAPVNMMGWWDADNVSGTTAADIRGGNHATLKNGLMIDSGYLCNAFNMDGVDDYVLIPDHDSLTFGNVTTDRAFSIECWVFMRDMTQANLFYKGSGSAREYSFRFTGTISDHLALGLYDDRRPSAGGLNSIGRRSVDTFTPDENSWIHVAATYDGSGTSAGIRLYRNGVALNTTVLAGTDSMGTNYVAMQNQAEAAVMGRFFNDGGTYANGLIDELSVYSYALSSTEVMAIFNAGNEGKCVTGMDNDTTNCRDFTTVGIPDQKDRVKSTLYPNPGHGKVNLALGANSTHVDVEIYDVSARPVKHLQFQNRSEIVFDFAEWPRGMYFMKVKTGRKTEQLKLLIH